MSDNLWREYLPVPVPTKAVQYTGENFHGLQRLLGVVPGSDQYLLIQDGAQHVILWVPGEPSVLVWPGNWIVNWIDPHTQEEHWEVVTDEKFASTYLPADQVRYIIGRV